MAGARPASRAGVGAASEGRLARDSLVSASATKGFFNAVQGGRCASEAHGARRCRESRLATLHPRAGDDEEAASALASQADEVEREALDLNTRPVALLREKDERRAISRLTGASCSTSRSRSPRRRRASALERLARSRKIRTALDETERRGRLLRAGAEPRACVPADLAGVDVARWYSSVSQSRAGSRPWADRFSSPPRMTCSGVRPSGAAPRRAAPQAAPEHEPVESGHAGCAMTSTTLKPPSVAMPGSPGPRSSPPPVGIENEPPSGCRSTISGLAPAGSRPGWSSRRRRERSRARRQIQRGL